MRFGTVVNGRRASGGHSAREMAAWTVWSAGACLKEEERFCPGLYYTLCTAPLITCFRYVTGPLCALRIFRSQRPFIHVTLVSLLRVRTVSLTLFSGSQSRTNQFGD